MTGRQRLLDTFAGKRTDRVPVAPFIHTNVVNEWFGTPPEDPIAACLKLYQEFGFDVILRNYIPGSHLAVGYATNENWVVADRTVGDLSCSWDVYSTITTPERVMTSKKSFRRVTPNEVVSATTECFIKGPEDFEQFKKYQPPVKEYDLSLITHAREVVGDHGLTGPWVDGVFNTCGGHRYLADLLQDPYEDDEFFLDMMEYFYGRVAAYVEQVFDAGADFISVSGNMASGSMAGPSMFRKYIMPFEKRLIDLAHSKGGKVIYHNCGDAKYLLPIYNEMGIDMYESLTAPPYGDTDLVTALNTIQPPTVLSGNLDQIHFLKVATPEEIRAEVKRVMDLVKPRGSFIFACTDYLCEGTPEANIRALAEAAMEYGKYE